MNVMWFRRDLRLADNPALLAAAAAGAVVPLFVFDPVLWKPAGPPRRAYLLRGLAALGERIEGGLPIRRGDPVTEVVAVARAAKAGAVHIAADFGPYGRTRDAAVEAALAAHGIGLVRTGSPYAVAPGRLRTQAGEPFKVFTPFFRAWAAHGWRAPAGPPRDMEYVRPVANHEPYAEPELGDLTLPAAGERAALQSWKRFLAAGIADYSTERDRADVDGTSYVPELRHLVGGAAHAPWDAPGGYAHGYPERIVEHAEERREAPARLEELRAR